MNRENEEKIILDVHQISVQIEDFSLKNITFQLKAGYITGLVGRGGSGKTSLIKTICNLYPKQSGSITVGDYDSVLQEAEAKNAIGLVMEELDYFSNNYTIWENAELLEPLYEVFDWERLEWYLKKYHIITGEQDYRKKYGAANKPLAEYSLGEQIRIKMALAIAHHPKLLILDEPTANLDTVFQRQFLEDLQELVETEEVAVLLCTHIITDLERVGDYILLLEDGEIIADGSKEELMDKFPGKRLGEVILALTRNGQTHCTIRREEIITTQEIKKKQGQMVYSNQEKRKRLETALNRIYHRSLYGKILFWVYVGCYCFCQVLYLILCIPGSLTKEYDGFMVGVMAVMVFILSARYYNNHYEYYNDEIYGFAAYLPIDKKQIRTCLLVQMRNMILCFGSIQLVLGIAVVILSFCQDQHIAWVLAMEFLIVGIFVPILAAIPPCRRFHFFRKT